MGWTDHDGVELNIANPAYSCNIKRAKHIHPPKFGAEDQVQKACYKLITEGSQMPIWIGISLSAVRSACIREAKDAAAAHRERLSQRRKRLLRKLYDAKLRTTSRPEPDLCRRFESLTIGDSDEIKSLESKLADVKLLRQERARNTSFRANQLGSYQEAKRFSRGSPRSSSQCNLFRSDQSQRPGVTHDRWRWLWVDWKPIFQQVPPDAASRQNWFRNLPSKANKPVFTSLTSAITEDEVRTAIDSLGKGKATGPDLIPNTWYQDMRTEIAPLLTTVFNQGLITAHLPESFKAATIHCIPKVSKPDTGLDFRPIALLISDYKLFTRILACAWSSSHLDS